MRGPSLCEIVQYDVPTMQSEMGPALLGETLVVSHSPLPVGTGLNPHKAGFDDRLGSLHRFWF